MKTASKPTLPSPKWRLSAFPTPDRGEAIVAAVTLAAGATLSAEALRAFAREHLAPHKVPARVEFVDEIPRTGPGKFKKRDLIERLATAD